jgi:cytochrome c-type biogenesis protein CcmH/NrfG
VTLPARGNVPDVTHASRPRTSWPRRPPPRWVAAILGIWIVVAGGAILVARALDSPVGAGARDEAQPAVPGPVAALDSDPGGEEGTFLALFPAEAPPADIAALPKAQRPARLRALIAGGAGGASVRVALGAALQEQGDGAGAQAAYREALRVAPGDLSARVGLALVLGAQAPPGPARGAARLETLASANPGSQVVLFNQGLLAVARGRAGEAREAWNRTVAAGPTTRLGILAMRALQALANVQPTP